MNLSNKKAFFLVLAIFTMAVLFISCASVPKEIPPDLTVKELVQKAQEASSVNNYGAAEVYYQTIIIRFGTDISVLVPAKFELAHLYIKQKNYDKAEPILQEVLDYYKDESLKLKPAYKKLAEIDMDKVEEHKKGSKKDSKKEVSESK